MITLEQIRLLESKITRAIELIRILKDENGTLRKGLESAQKRMKELEVLVDGFKTDQREIESVIVRTLHNLDELEESAAAGKRSEHAGASSASAPASPPAAPTPSSAPSAPVASALKSEAAESHPPRRAPVEATEKTGMVHEPPAAKEELDIF
jgi:hypothetical protein